MLEKSFYIDNCVTSMSDQYELDKLVRESKTLMPRACFDLEVGIPVLGLKWNRNLGTLELNMHIFKSLHDQRVTKNLFYRLHTSCLIL